jgi:TolA-binding protein
VDALAAGAETYQSFRELFPDSQEAALALLQEASLRYDVGDVPAATKLLDDFYQSTAPLTLRMQARLRALQIASETGAVDRVQSILFETDWTTDSMPDIAVLSFAALEAGDLFLEQSRYPEALRAYRLVYPKDLLIEKQQDRLLQTETNLRQQSPLASSIWTAHTQQLIARLKKQLETLKNMEDYTPGLFLRAGQTYLLSSRYREASILFRTITQSEQFDETIRAEAHYRWILTQCEAEHWPEARQIAEDFLREHPKHGLAQSALFLIARSYQGQGQFTDAISVLDTLIENYPNDRQAARWYFTRGYNYSVLEDQSGARSNFETSLERFPKSPLAEQTELWLGLTYFFERNYTESLKRLESLQKASRNHPIQPEVRFRIANIHYAQRDYATTLEIADSMIQDYPDHHRVSEMLALKGDSYMGLGELIQAAAAFKKVPADDAQIYDYSVFQANKIYKALERYDLMQSHLQAYVDRDDANERPRVSEALYWIGWAMQQDGRTVDAYPIYDAALERFGNDPKARAVESILSAYAQLYKAGNAPDRLELPTFDVWLQKQLEISLPEKRLTWFARLTAFKAAQQARAGSKASADASLLSIHRFVPIDAQDPATLAKVGLVLAERAYTSADDYFEYILTEYPKRPERAAAYYGKALLASQQDRLGPSRRWLVRFLEETPAHPLAPNARILAADILTKQGLYAAARDGLNEILQIKEMRGRPHARALAGLARIDMAEAQPTRAIPYWKRIYTLYRAYPEIVAEAYWESAQLFAEIDDPIAARNTVREFLKDPRMQAYASFQKAEAILPEYEAAAKARSDLAATPQDQEAPL